MQQPPKLFYSVDDKCVINVNGTRMKGKVIASFDTPWASEKQYIILMEDPAHPNMEVRDALRMETTEAPPPFTDVALND